MFTLLHIILFFLTALSFGIFSFTFLKERSFALLPALGWITLINIPFLMAWPYYPEPYRSLHITGICIVSGFLLMSDFISFLFLKKTTAQTFDYTQHTQLMNYATWSVTGILFLIIAYHLSHVDTIPLFEILLNHADKSSAAIERNAFQRDMPIPFYMRYLINFNPYIFGALAITLHWLAGRKRTSISIALLIIGYSLLSTAKIPVLLSLMIIAMLIGQYGFKRIRYLPHVFFAAYIGVIIGIIGFYKFVLPDVINRSTDYVFIATGPTDPRTAHAPSDYFRTPEFHEASLKQTGMPRNFEYFMYRAILTPADAASRWYQYFSYVQKSPETFASMMGRALKNGFVHPCLKVGDWGYHQKFPDKYETIPNTYASLDADAFAYGGLKSVVFVAVLFAVLRMCFALFHTNTPFSQTLHMTGLVILTITPANASLQAILAPHGILPILGLMGVIWLWLYFKNKQAQKTV
jgi:hypothetical protein